MARVIRRPFMPDAQCSADCIHAAFPRCMEDWFVLFVDEGTHILHAPHVVDSIHSRPPAFVTDTFETPIIESRVTREASSCSVIFSVPAGRSGRTVYRSAAVLSQTWRAMFSGSVS